MLNRVKGIEEYLGKAGVVFTPPPGKFRFRSNFLEWSSCLQLRTITDKPPKRRKSSVLVKSTVIVLSHSSFQTKIGS